MENFELELNPIINYYKKDVEHVKGQTEREVFCNFIQHVDTNEIQVWVQKLFNINSLKCVEKAQNYREIGNSYFKERKFKVALKFYSKSVTSAPFDSQEFYLAVGNRSAALFNLQNYKDCVQDIQLCLSNYPETLKYKLYNRLVTCYIKLELFSNASQVLNDFKIYLKNETELTNDVKECINNEISQMEVQIAEKKANPNGSNLNDHLNIPDFKSGENDKFSGASNQINLRFNETKGRHVIATEDIKLGDILFIEKAFAFVPILKEDVTDDTQICYHCFKIIQAPIPCKNCEELFCSETCRNAACKNYHCFECLGSCVQIWPKIGVNFLALRMLLLGAKSGYSNLHDQTNVDHFGNAADNYKYVYSLVSNIEKMEKADILPHLVSAIAITLYLKTKTEFFSHLKQVSKDLSSKSDENLFEIIGSTLLKHILQVISNASTIETVHNEFYNKFNSLEQLTNNFIYVSGVGIYPSVSMMNHSCNTNITNYFINEYIIVKANRDINKGEEIFNSYGYDCRKHVTEKRQINLKKQYCFECKCSACTYPTKPEIFYEGLLCQQCGNYCLTANIEQQESQSQNERIYKCTQCNHEFNANNHFSYIRKAEQNYEKYETTKDVDYLKKCLELREKVFYKYNYCLYTVHLKLQTFYGYNGNFELWWHHTKKSLEMDKHILGESSLCSANNLRLSLIIILDHLSNFTIENIEEQNMDEIKMLNYVSAANEMFQKCQKIFKLFYPEDKLKYDIIHDLLQDVITLSTILLRNNLFQKQIGDNLDEKFNDFLNT